MATATRPTAALLSRSTRLRARHAARVLVGPGYFRNGEAVITTAGAYQAATATLKANTLYVIIDASNKGAAAAAVRALTR